MRHLRKGLLAGAVLGASLAGQAIAQGETAPAPAGVPAIAAPEPAPAPVIASTGDPVLDKAIADARATLGHFWDHAAKFPSQDYWHIVKIGLPATGGGVENVWVYTTEKQGNDLKGVIVTQPESLASGLRKGGNIEFQETGIIDWSYFEDDGLRRGEYTKRAEFAALPPEEIAGELEYAEIHPSPVP